MISPIYDEEIQLFSPNKKFKANLNNMQEVCMSGPTSGNLTIGSLQITHCSPSIVWSDDSKYLAVPQWLKKNSGQGLLIILVERMIYRFAPGHFKVLQLENFKNTVVYGIDSPFHNPRNIEIDISKIDWN